MRFTFRSSDPRGGKNSPFSLENKGAVLDRDCHKSIIYGLGVAVPRVAPSSEDHLGSDGNQPGLWENFVSYTAESSLFLSINFLSRFGGGRRVKCYIWKRSKNEVTFFPQEVTVTSP